MKNALLTTLCVLVLFVMAGCVKKQLLTMDRRDVVDHDFVASIQKTSDPYIFEVEIKRINPKVDKKIGNISCIVDLVLKGSSGKTFSGKPWETAVYAEEVTEVFGSLRQAAVDSLVGRIRLIRSGLSPGTYIVEPRVRIEEVGKDRLHGPYPDGGTVAVPAGNSVMVTIAK